MNIHTYNLEHYNHELRGYTDVFSAVAENPKDFIKKCFAKGDFEITKNRPLEISPIHELFRLKEEYDDNFELLFLAKIGGNIKREYNIWRYDKDKDLWTCNKEGEDTRILAISPHDVLLQRFPHALNRYRYFENHPSKKDLRQSYTLVRVDASHDIVDAAFNHIRYFEIPDMIEEPPETPKSMKPSDSEVPTVYMIKIMEESLKDMDVKLAEFRIESYELEHKLDLNRHLKKVYGQAIMKLEQQIVTLREKQEKDDPN